MTDETSLADLYVPLSTRAPNQTDLVRVWLTAVGVFGDDCPAECCQAKPEEVPVPLGLSDLTPGWSDCNRAWGRIFRVEEEDSVKAPEHCAEIWVPRSELWKLTYDWTQEDV